MKWALLALAAAAVGATFFIECDEPADAVGGDKPNRAAAVAVAAVTADTLVERVAYPGELDADTADIAAIFAGRLDAVHVRIGDVVAQGDALATVAIVDLAEQRAEVESQVRAARADIQRIRAELEAAQREAARFAKLEGSELVSEHEADAARTRARALQADSQRAIAAAAEADARVAMLGRHEIENRVRAPFAGRVADRFLDAGNFVQPATRLLRLVAIDVLRVRFEVPEQDVGRVKVGAGVDVSIPALGTESAPATVSGIGGEVLRDRRVVIVEALLARHPESWLSGMYAAASVVHQRSQDQPVVPAAALLSRLGPEGQPTTGVFRRDDKVARWVPVTVVARDGDRVAVRGDLKTGAEVLVQGHQDLADGAPIRVAGKATR